MISVHTSALTEQGYCIHIGISAPAGMGGRDGGDNRKRGGDGGGRGGAGKKAKYIQVCADTKAGFLFFGYPVRSCTYTQPPGCGGFSELFPFHTTSFIFNRNIHVRAQIHVSHEALLTTLA